MKHEFTVSGRIGRPVRDVYEAVADPAILSRYFTTGGARGRMETGATVWWDFADFPGEFPVTVVAAAEHSRIVFRWDAAVAEDQEPYQTTVTFTFDDTGDGRTLVRITETGWREDETGVAASYGNCAGWMQMLCAMKAWLEHGIVIREGMFV